MLESFACHIVNFLNSQGIIGRRRKVDEWIGCDVCGRWFHGRCVGIKKIADWTEVDYLCKDCEEPYHVQNPFFLCLLLC